MRTLLQSKRSLDLLPYCLHIHARSQRFGKASAQVVRGAPGVSRTARSGPAARTSMPLALTAWACERAAARKDELLVFWPLAESVDFEDVSAAFSDLALPSDAGEPREAGGVVVPKPSFSAATTLGVRNKAEFMSFACSN